MTIRTRLATLAMAFAGVVSLVGASGGSAPAAAGPAARAEGRLDRDWTRGAFWLPAGSEAERPALRLAPTAWDPRPAAPSIDR